jgi:hypothetical protein
MAGKALAVGALAFLVACADLAGTPSTSVPLFLRTEGGETSTTLVLDGSVDVLTCAGSRSSMDRRIIHCPGRAVGMCRVDVVSSLSCVWTTDSQDAPPVLTTNAANDVHTSASSFASANLSGACPDASAKPRRGQWAAARISCCVCPCRIVRHHCNGSAPVKARHWSPRVSKPSLRTAHDSCRHERALLPGAVRAQRGRSGDLCRTRDPRSLVPAATCTAQHVAPSVQYAQCIMQPAATTCEHRPYDARRAAEVLLCNSQHACTRYAAHAEHTNDSIEHK